jgi:tricorn protease
MTNHHPATSIKNIILTITCLFIASSSIAQGTRLLRQPSLSATHIAFTYGADIWVSDLNGQNVTRITSTPAVESNPHFSPDGKWIAFSSNRSGNTAVYVVSINGGTPKRLTWHPSGALARGWTPDGKRIVYATGRDSAPTGFDHLWTVSAAGGPSTIVSQQWGTDGSYSPDGKQIVLDRMDRWDVEFRNYRGGQNTPLVILTLADQSEKLIPTESTFDIQPLWLGDKIYFISDRDWTSNIWSYSASGELKQITTFTGSDVKWLGGNTNKLVFERDGYLHLYDLATNTSTQHSITIHADFPWAETKWEDVTRSARAVAISPTGKRVILEARGEIFTSPVENGDARNITQTSTAADHAPVWSPKGNEIAWFSDTGGKGYSLMIASQDGLSKPRSISIGESKMAWEPAWSPDGKFIAFADDDVRIRIVDVTAGTIKTVDTGGDNNERGNMDLTWSHDSRWLAYTKTGSNKFRRITIWSVADNSIHYATNSFADSFSPAWDRDGRHLYFLATVDLALASGWANTSSQMADPKYNAYVINLRKDDLSPFKPKSDEEAAAEEKKTDDKKTVDAKSKDNKSAEALAKAEKPADKKEDAKDAKDKPKEPEAVIIHFDNIERRTISLPPAKANYQFIKSGPAGTAFIGERKPGARDLVIHKYTLEKNEAKEFTSGATQVSISSDGNKMLAQVGGSWKVMNTSGPKADDGMAVKINLKMKLNRTEEWTQMFEEAWRYERDYFYDPAMHGRNWNDVHDRYAPLVPFIKHRADLTYILDQVNGELSVGHSFVFGGDFPEVDKPAIGLLGADLVAENKRWKINRIYTTESWNPELTSPLDRPGIKIQEGNYLVGINGKELTDADDPYQFLDGTLDVQTTLHINKTPDFAGAWQEIVKPIASENNLRQRAWVEDNRRMVDKLSNGKLAYVWVPDTGGDGFISFNRYFFAQQDKKGLVIDERFNGGGFLDDYMTDLMNRKLRAALTNEVPNGEPSKLPAGILGPKVLLINELAGSGGDFFPWVFKQQKTGPLIGARTWGGLVKSSVHYSLVDGGALTAPDNAVFDPFNNKWIAENEGVAPDIEVRQDAASLSKGIDPQLERGVKEALRLLEQQGEIKVTPPPFPTPAKKN